MENVNSVQKVESFILQVLDEEQIAADFHCLISYTAEDQKKKAKKYQETLKTLFLSFSEEELVPALGFYVERISRAYNKSRLLTSLLHYTVVNNHVSPKLVCEALVKCPFLVCRNEEFWCLSFRLIDEIISSIDYKGVRDLFKGILEKASGIELSVNVSYMNQLRAIQKVLEKILDRNACLLPAYLVLDELQKKYPAGRPHLHSKFSSLITNFVDSFRPTAQMVSISVFMRIKGDESAYRDFKLLPIVGHSTTSGNVWKLDPVTARASMKGLLPYNEELFEPQTLLLRYVLKHSYSRDLVCSMLGVNKLLKQRSPALESELVEVIVSAMDESDIEVDEMEDGCSVLLLWQHLASQLIYIVLSLSANFSEFVDNLHRKLRYRKSLKGREHLMWTLLQFLSGSIKKQKLNYFLSIMKLYDQLYPEKDPLPVPDFTKATSVYILAATALWIHLKKKAQVEQANLTRNLPKALTAHLEYLQNARCDNDLPLSLHKDYRIPLLCNAYSTNQESFKRPMGIIVDAVQGTQNQPTPLTGPKIPISMDTLDSLTVHTKMSLIHSIVSYIANKLAPQKTAEGMGPALMETYARLLVYREIESLGIKGFIEQLLPVVFQCHAWSILHTVLEMFSYRLHHFQLPYRMKLLNHLHGLSAVSQTNQTQLHICVESTALKLIVGMRSGEVQPQLSRLQAESKHVSNDSEELNKVLVLTIARSIHITGSGLSDLWCQDILSDVMQHTPHCWSSFTLQCFPRVLRDFFVNHQVPRENMTQLKRSVEEEYKKWKTMSNEKDIILHFSRQGSSPLFLCLMWKMLLDQERISTIAYEILDRIGARALSTHLRAFADFLVYEFSFSAVGQHISNYIQALNDLIWKCHAIQLDRLILCLALRNFEGNEAQVCFFVIQMLLLKPQEFKKRVNDFVENNSPEHWKLSDWHEKHMKFQRNYEEKFYFEGLRNINATNSHHTYLPVYFGNVCLRFLPVMDIVIQRFIELPTAAQLDNMLDELGCLYKFHDQPLTYLFDTLHYYEQKLCDRPLLKKKLVATIVGSLKSIRPEGWALSEEYLAFIQDTSEELTWVPDHEYYVKLVRRLVDTLGEKSPFPHLDWRFNEFTNEEAHALYVTCIELMALPVPTNNVGNALVDIIHKSRTAAVYSNIIPWMNAVGLLLTTLPEAFFNVLNDRILETIQSPLLSNPYPSMNPFDMFDFAGSFNRMVEMPCSYLIGLTHSVWYHASFGQICTLPRLLKEKFKPAVKTEVQLIFLCHLVAPFLQRFAAEKLRCILEITVELYEMMEIVDKNCEEWHYVDVICDLFYHIKYMYTGDAINSEIEKCIRNLRSDIQHKLRFIVHLNLGEISMEV